MDESRSEKTRKHPQEANCSFADILKFDYSRIFLINFEKIRIFKNLFYLK